MPRICFSAFRPSRGSRRCLGPQSSELLETRSSAATQAGSEVLNTLLTCTVSHAFKSREDSLVYALIARQLRRRIARGRQAKLGFLNVALLERAVAFRMERECTRETVRGGLVLV